MDKNPSYNELQRDKIRTVFWVAFPQGIKNENEHYITYSSTMIAKTKKKAWKLLLKYNGAFIEKLYVTKHYGTRSIYIISRTEDMHLNFNELWDKYSNLPEIKIGELK